mmetsp:Transcript_52463/g.122003  ORF Transcript_52463/g.122003 Transcript_52463/m.122003 type:complete len:322 (-) Transcript_52463:245-1210(-)
MTPGAQCSAGGASSEAGVTSSSASKSTFPCRLPSSLPLLTLCPSRLSSLSSSPLLSSLISIFVCFSPLVSSGSMIDSAARSFSKPAKTPRALVLLSLPVASRSLRGSVFTNSWQLLMMFVMFVNSPRGLLLLSLPALVLLKRPGLSCSAASCCAAGTNSGALAESVPATGQTAVELSLPSRFLKRTGWSKPASAVGSVASRLSGTNAGECRVSSSTQSSVSPQAFCVGRLPHGHSGSACIKHLPIAPASVALGESSHAYGDEWGILMEATVVHTSGDCCTNAPVELPEPSGTALFMSTTRLSMICGSARQRSAAARESSVT